MSRLRKAIENDDLDTIKTVTQLIDVNAMIYYDPVSITSHCHHKIHNIRLAVL